MEERICRISPELAGQRLDQALAVLLPGLGLRGRKRCIERGGVLVNGRTRPAAYRLRLDDELLLREEGDTTQAAPVREPEGFSGVKAAGRATAKGRLAFPADPPRFLARQNEYCFLYKPAGLHSVALASGGGPSLEALLQGLLPPETGPARLLQRLDYITSGIVCAALSESAAGIFRRAEFAGRCEKRYLALLDGILPGPVTARQALGTDSRRKSRLRADTEDRSRWTEFFPLHSWAGAEAASLLAALERSGPEPERNTERPLALTLAACRIRRGARHQIRAHAASLGYPLWGDGLYGRATPGTGEKEDAGRGALLEAGFFLHHGGLWLPGAGCALPPPWSLPASVAGEAGKWLESPTC